jgi:hypothetical protein
LRRADPPSEESYRPCKKDYETEEVARAQQRAVQSLGMKNEIKCMYIGGLIMIEEGKKYVSEK